MDNNSSDIVACIDIGSRATGPSCCYANNQSDPTCQDIFSQQDGLLQKGCRSDHCMADCQNATALYSSLVQTDLTGNGQGPITRYAACVNVPAIFKSLSQGVLSLNFSSSARQYIPTNTTEDSLQNITSTVTDCLSSTCRHSRNPGLCYDNYCSPVKLLANDTTPNVTAINGCLNQLCYSGFSALPYADVDVVGIGVLVSYVLQCIFIVALWSGFFISAVVCRLRRHEATRSSGVSDSWIDLLLEFHKAQCYFSGTLMIAALAYGIYETDMLVTYMLIPLATNGVLPITFAYLLLVYYNKPSVGVTLLTVTVYILSSIVYWSLYAHLIPIGSKTTQYSVYEQFMYKLSSIPACGGYSALAVCPDNMTLGTAPVRSAGEKLRVLTPLIWAFSTIVLVSLLGHQLYQWHCERRNSVGYNPPPECSDPQRAYHKSIHSLVWRIAFWVTTVAFLAGIGMQVSLLTIATSLKMTDYWNWTFGQVVAVTIWIPPLLEYLYGESIYKINERRRNRMLAP